ncbi:hypothetical protein AK812_SmicGene39115 [Symbiodinium microadriaticum]|uniref:Uncharacterized protein n=1 Tax=Symbiodinium microadriaticum TaxID=2951 RepID=A0A1Q9CCA6_SYMMI|nr:hypothetical protein AK812_SmicGene39115 [Symbiodinium microadriaticum]CAE7703621.1 unnamed protein product [Symbiodinium microadriaticum]
MSVKPELLKQIRAAVEHDAERDEIPVETTTEDPGDGAAMSAASISRKKVCRNVEMGHHDATVEWHKAEAALSTALRSKVETEAEDAEMALYVQRVQKSVDNLLPHSPSAGFSGTDSQERSGHIAEKGTSAFLERARLMRCRASDAGKKLKDHAKRRLRIKITDIFKEVGRRQSLRQSQEKVRKFREDLHQHGFGPNASTGDADFFALGIGATTDSYEDDATPRRRCLLESLSLEELAMVRANPRWYIEASLQDGEDENVHANRERLIDFFTPARKDRHVSIECYSQRLWSRLAASEAIQESQDSRTASGRLRSLFGRGPGPGFSGSRMTSQGLSPQPSTMQSVADSQMFSSLSAGSLPRREPIRADQPSPTMEKVWERHRRKEARDAQMLEDRRLAAEERMAKNAFKVSQQLSEYESSQSKYKELHKLRMSDALDRKAARDAENQERLAVMDEFKLRKIRHALDVADEQLERKRDKVSEGLEAWQSAVRRARRYQHVQERKALAKLQANQEAYNARLAKVGETRSEKTESQAQKNDKLKARIQVSLMQQLDEQRKLECDRILIASEQKVEAARYRRYHSQNKYNFLERAFGEQVKFDHKYAFTPSRKGRHNTSSESL